MPRAGTRTRQVEDDAPTLARVPWSQIRGDFIRTWGYADGKFDPEHVEILGPSGSGKSYMEATILTERVKARDSVVIFIATKPLDKTIAMIGWPVVDDFREVRKHRQVIFWPRTSLVGTERKAYLETKIYDLLTKMWSAKTKAVIVAFDEIATVEGLSSRMKDLIGMYWREARSVGITIVAMKQRGQGVLRDMHSEAAWIAAFKPKHEEDGQFVGQAMGSWRTWLPVLQSLDRGRREFVLLHSVSGDAVITWIDAPLKSAAPQRRGAYRKAS